MIPDVRPWIVSTLDHDSLRRERWIVWAPTRNLARLNFRHEVGFRLTIETIGATRKDYPRPVIGLVQQA